MKKLTTFRLSTSLFEIQGRNLAFLKKRLPDRFYRNLGITLFLLSFFIAVQAQDETKITPEFFGDTAYGSEIDIYEDEAVVLAKGEFNGTFYGRIHVYKYSTSIKKWVKTQSMDLNYGRIPEKVDVAMTKDFIAATAYDHTLNQIGNVSIYQRNDHEWVEMEEISKQFGYNNEHRFGQSLDLHLNRLIIGAPGGSPNGGVGAIYIYEYTNGTWVEMLRYRSLNIGDQLGTSVAINNNFAVAGAPTDFIGGTVEVFEKVGTQWQYSQNLRNPTRNPGDFFGNAVDLDRDWLVVGAEQAVNNGNITGAVYLYDTNNWTQTQQISGTQVDSQFGSAVAINTADPVNKYLAVGAPGEGTQGNAYMYTYLNSQWSERGKISQIPTTLQNSVSTNRSGSSVAVSSCCDAHFLVGDPGFGYSSNNKIGAVLAYQIERVSARLTYVENINYRVISRGYDEFGTVLEPLINGADQMLYIGATGINGIHLKELSTGREIMCFSRLLPGFGKAIAYNNDKLLIGAPDQGTGKVHEYHITPKYGRYDAANEIPETNLNTGDQYGFSIERNGKWVIVGAPGYAQSRGAVFIYEAHPSSANSRVDDYTFVQRIEIPQHQNQPGAQFGYTLDMTDSTIAVSAPFWDANSNQPSHIDRGAVFIYQLDPSAQRWNYTQSIWRTTLLGQFADVRFGHDLDLQVNAQGTTQLLIGSPGDYLLGAYGAAFMYELGTLSGVRGFWLADTIVASDRNFYIQDDFGASVSLDGDRILVGASVKGSNNPSPRAAYYYEYDNGQWDQISKLTPKDKYGAGDYGYYASEVLLMGDYAIIGDPGDNEVASEAGAVYIYDLSTLNTGNRPTLTIDTEETPGNFEEPKLYPNPTYGDFQLKIPKGFGQIKQAYLIDKLGRKQLVSWEEKGGEVKLNEHLASGLYMLRVEFETHSPVTFRLLVK